MAVRKENGILFNIDSQVPNKVVKEWLDGQGYDKVVPEYTYGDSRIDFYMERSGVVPEMSCGTRYVDDKGMICMR